MSAQALFAPPVPASFTEEAGTAQEWPWQFGRQRRYGVNQPFDPYRRLLAAVAVQAVIDLVNPPAKPVLTDWERHTAFVFVCQHRHLYHDLNISQDKLDFLAEWLEVRQEVAA